MSLALCPYFIIFPSRGRWTIQCCTLAVRSNATPTWVTQLQNLTWRWPGEAGLPWHGPGLAATLLRLKEVRELKGAVITVMGTRDLTDCVYIYYYCYYYYIYYYHLLFIIIYYYCYCYYYTLFGPFILHLDSFGRIVSSNQGSHWGGKPNSIIYWFLQCGYGEHIVYEIDISYTTCTSQTETCTSHLHVNIIHNACLYRSHIHISSSSLCARKIKQSCWVTCGFTTATIPDAEFQMQISLEFTWAIFKTPEVDYCGLKRILPNFSFIIHYGNPWLSDAIEWNDAMRTMRVLRPGERMTTRAQRLRCCIYMQLGTMHGKLHKCWMMLIFFANLNVVTFASVMW